MTQEKKPELSEELSDLVEFILSNSLYHSNNLDMFPQSERFALYDAVGDKFVKEGKLERAATAYTQEGRDIPPEITKQIGDIYFDVKCFDEALHYYEKVSELVPENRFNTLAHYYISFSTFDLDKAMQCSQLAGAKISPLTFTAVAERFIEQGDVSTADKLYLAADKELEEDIELDKKELVRIGNNLLTQEKITQFWDVYLLAKEKLPIKKMLKQADKCLDKFKQNRHMSSLDNAFNLYDIAKKEAPNKKIIKGLAEIAELYFEYGEPIRAAGILKNIGKQVSFEKFIEAGDEYFYADKPVHHP